MNNDFDEMTAIFSARVRRAADWKHSYLGAAYSPSTHCFVAEQERALHWRKLFENYWSDKRGWL